MKILRAHCEVRETEAGVRLATRYGELPDKRPHVFVHLETERFSGCGEATPLTWFTGETSSTIASILTEQWLPRVVGRRAHDVDSMLRELARGVPHNSSAMAAIDAAVHDLRARSVGLPLHEFLGGHGATVLRRTYPLGIGDIDSVVSEAREWVERGYTTLKMKIGLPVEESRDRVAAVREAVGTGVRIRVDANAGYDLRTARRAVRMLAPYDLELFEQPVPAHDIGAWRSLRRITDIPLMADESLRTLADALALVSERLVDHLLIKLIKTGGVRNAVRIAGIAEAAGVDCIVSTPFDTEVGAAAAAHTAFAIGSLERAHDLPPHPIESTAPVGWIGRPEGVGIGVDALADPSEVSWAGESRGAPS
jgi:L-alanine-DL-glutamate epimerase-like enolase superfamily enzyme